MMTSSRKIWEKHHVDAWEVEDVVFDDPEAEAWWASDRKHGRRLMIVGRTRGARRLLVILQPVNRRQGIWSLRSSWDHKG